MYKRQNNRASLCINMKKIILKKTVLISMITAYVIACTDLIVTVCLCDIPILSHCRFSSFSLTEERTVIEIRLAITTDVYKRQSWSRMQFLDRF